MYLQKKEEAATKKASEQERFVGSDQELFGTDGSEGVLSDDSSQDKSQPFAGQSSRRTIDVGSLFTSFSLPS